MSTAKRLQVSLFLLRIGVFIVMFMWTLDKFLFPGHAQKVFQRFYFISGMDNLATYAIAAVEMVILAGFLFGIKKRFTYGAVLAFHSVSTFASYQMYLSPFNDLKFFAAFPMLAACVALYLLREEDKLFNVRLA